MALANDELSVGKNHAYNGEWIDITIKRDTSGSPYGKRTVDAQGVGLQLDHEDLEQVDEFDLKEIDLKWHVAMISTRLKSIYKKTRIKLHFNAKEPIGFNKRKVECFNCHNTGHFAREYRSKGNQDSRRRDAGNTRYKERDNRKRPVKQDEHKSMVTIDGEGVDWTGHAEDDTEDYALMVFNSTNSGLDTEKLLAEAKKEKEELKTKLENFQSSSKGLSKLLNSQMSTKDKFTLRSSDVEDSHVNDRFEKVEGMHAVPPYMTWNYMPPKSDFGIDESKFTYGSKQSATSESDAKTSDLDSYESSSGEETLETMPKLIESKPKVVNEPKVWSDAPIIKEYESDNDDEYVSKALVEQDKPSYAFINTVKHVKTLRIEAIRIFLAFASYMRFIAYQMDVKSAFLYGKIDEEVYVSQPTGFIDPKSPNKVYKVGKALYGLHQPPRAWYATLSTFPVQSGYIRGLIYKTLFIKKDKKDIMLVQVYVDDIIFGSTKKSWCDEFEALIKNRCHMSSMGELTFFLGLQVKEKEDGIS
nr:copia protein [Tanacetum cinerariifolium]